MSQLTSAYATPVDADTQARYSEWADRLRQKHTRLHQDLTTTTAPSYWTTDALFEESRRLDQEDLHTRPNPWRVEELLAVLDLRTGATPGEIGDAYRKLAKEHHPDRFVSADTATQTLHAERMISIMDAYKALRDFEKAQL